MRAIWAGLGRDVVFSIVTPNGMIRTSRNQRVRRITREAEWVRILRSVWSGTECEPQLRSFMAILTITYRGTSAVYPLEISEDIGDADIKRIAVEVIRSGEVPGLQIGDLGNSAFMHFVVDRFDTPEGGKRLYLRPKVPFGAL